MKEHAVESAFREFASKEKCELFELRRLDAQFPRRKVFESEIQLNGHYIWEARQFTFESHFGHPEIPGDTIITALAAVAMVVDNLRGLCEVIDKLFIVVPAIECPVDCDPSKVKIYGVRTVVSNTSLTWESIRQASLNLLFGLSHFDENLDLPTAAPRSRSMASTF